MEAKHTPGPWITEIQKERDGEFTPFFDVRSDDPNMKSICSCTNFGWLGDDGLDSAEANAHLIAAAPDMLEACKMAIALFQAMNVFDDGNRISGETIKAIKSAINKATQKN